jgi:hypothetical protein
MGDPFSLESAQPFMDIYQSAMDPAVRQIQDQTLQAQNEARAKASRGGAGFGSRLGIVESQTTGEGARAAGDLGRVPPKRVLILLLVDMTKTDKHVLVPKMLCMAATAMNVLLDLALKNPCVLVLKPKKHLELHK